MAVHNFDLALGLLLHITDAAAGNIRQLAQFRDRVFKVALSFLIGAAISSILKLFIKNDYIFENDNSIKNKVLVGL